VVVWSSSNDVMCTICKLLKQLIVRLKPDSFSIAYDSCYCMRTEPETTRYTKLIICASLVQRLFVWQKSFSLYLRVDLDKKKLGVFIYEYKYSIILYLKTKRRNSLSHMDLCSSMKYLQVDCINNMNINSFLRFILKKEENVNIMNIFLHCVFVFQ
jgi:hypothetical protein